MGKTCYKGSQDSYRREDGKFVGGQLNGGTKKLKVRLNKDERCTRYFDITETANYGRSIVSCVKT